MPVDPASVNKILVVATKFFGDLIISSPGLKALRQKFPAAKITVLVRKEYGAVLRNNPDINGILSFDFGIRKKNFFIRIAEEMLFWKMIRKERFDMLISLQPGDRIAFLSRISGAKYRVAPRKQSFNYLFNILVDVEEDSISYLEYYNKIISAVTGAPVTGKPEFFLSAENEAWANEFLRSNNFDINNTMIAVHPGASEPTKIWKAENYAALVNNMLKMSRTNVLLVQGPNEEKIVEKVLKDINCTGVIVLKSNDVNITAALLKKCILLVSNDTGTRHLATALNVPVIVLMPDDNSKCWDFYNGSDRHYIIKGKRVIAAENSYLNGISFDAVLKKVKEVLG
jgi:ADP-heptose:LPS heptosyltransferase